LPTERHRGQDREMDIAIVAYDNMAALDAIGPFQVLSTSA
jgi:hypothetical protein